MHLEIIIALIVPVVLALVVVTPYLIDKDK
jgi:hypothetical protein